MTTLARLSCSLAVLFCACSAGAAPWARLAEEAIERVARRTVCEAEERVILSRADDVPAILARYATAELDDAALRGRFRRLKGVDAALERELATLASPAERRFVVELAEGAQQAVARIPADDGRRILAYLDADGLAQSRVYGGHVVDGMVWVQSPQALEGLRVAVPPELRGEIAKRLGMDAAAVPNILDESQLAELWKAAVRRTGAGGAEFWRKWVAPHKGKWLVGGAFLAYLAMPESFHDGLGNLTEYGARKLAELGVDTAIAIPSGVLEGFWGALSRRYQEAPLRTALGSAAAAILIVLAVGPFRRLTFATIRATVSLLRGRERDRASPTAGTVGRVRSRTPLHE